MLLYMLLTIPQHPEDHNILILNVCLDNWLETPENQAELASFKGKPLYFILTLCYPFKLSSVMQNKYHIVQPNIHEITKFWFDKVAKRITCKQSISVFNASKIYCERAEVIINISNLKQEKIKKEAQRLW